MVSFTTFLQFKTRMLQPVNDPMKEIVHQMCRTCIPIVQPPSFYHAQIGDCTSPPSRNGVLLLPQLVSFQGRQKLDFSSPETGKYSNIAPRGPPSKRKTSKKTAQPEMPFRVGFGSHSFLSTSECMADFVSHSPGTTEMDDVVSRSVTATSDSSETTKSQKKRKWSSEVWNDYVLYDGSVFVDGVCRAVCKFCMKGPILAQPREGTTNFLRHTNKCQARLVALDNQGLMSKDGKVVRKFDQNLYKEMVSLAIIRHGYPFTYVEHVGYRYLHMFLNEEYKPICRNTAKSHVMKVHIREKERLKEFMLKIPGRICLTSDMWTSVVDQGYLSLTAHYIDDDWNLHAKLLSFCHVEPPHTALMLHDNLFKLLKEWGIEKKVFSIPLDNARTNDNMQEYLAESLSFICTLPCGGDYFHVRCRAHILNLIVQDGLKVISDVVKKIRKLVNYNVASEHRKLKFLEIAKVANVDCTRMLSLDCPTRWNSTYKMLSRALIYRVLFSRKICAILSPFDQLTTLISGKKYPTTNLYLKSVWRIELLIRQYATCDDVFLRDMTSTMKLKFDKYWESYSVVFSIAAMLDPRYRFQFVLFCFQELDKVSHTETAELKANYVKEQFCRLFDEYANLSTTSPTTHGNLNRNDNHIEDHMAAFASFDGFLEDKSELDSYLHASRLNYRQDLDVLSWWKENSIKYSILAAMARDILAIPITTVASESSFSMGSRVLTKWRSSLSPDTADALLSTRSWLFGFHVEEGASNENQDLEGLEYRLKNTTI